MRTAWRATALLLGILFGQFLLATAASADTVVVPNWPYVCRDHAAVFNIRIVQGDPGVPYPVRVKVGDEVFGPVNVQLGQSKELLVYARGSYRVQVGNAPSYYYDKQGPDQIPCHDIQQPTNNPGPVAAKTQAAKQLAATQPRQGLGGPALARAELADNLMNLGLVLGVIDVVGWIAYIGWARNWWPALYRRQ